MGRTQTHATVFPRGSNVLEYWLAHAEGFHVAGGAGVRERVEGVLLDPVDGRASELIVRSALRRRRVLPAEAVAAVDPFAGRLHLERAPAPQRPPRHSSPRLRPQLARARPHVARAAQRVAWMPARVLLAAVRLLARALAWLLPRAWAAAAAAARWAAPRAGRAAVAATRWVLQRLRVAAAAALTGSLAAGAAGARHSARLARQAAARRRRPAAQPDDGA